MDANADFRTSLADREFVVTRLFAAPRALVFAMWTEAKHLARWFVPHGMSASECVSDARPGGRLRIVVRSPDGRDMPMSGEFREVVAPERLVYTTDMTEHPDDFYAMLNRERTGRGPIVAVNTVTFEEDGEFTRVTARVRFASDDDRDALVKTGMTLGWRQLFDKLAAQLAFEGAGPVFDISREFDAPRTMVFDAWSTPEALSRWWGPKGFALEVISLDFAPGGIFHYGMHGAEGTPMAGHSMWGRIEYFAIERPARLSLVTSFADASGAHARHPMAPTWPLKMLSEITFEERGGRTTVRLRSTPCDATAEERRTFEAGFDSMRGGFGGTFDALADYLAAERRTKEGIR